MHKIHTLLICSRLFYTKILPSFDQVNIVQPKLHAKTAFPCIQIPPWLPINLLDYFRGTTFKMLRFQKFEKISIFMKIQL